MHQHRDPAYTTVPTKTETLQEQAEIDSQAGRTHTCLTLPDGRHQRVPTWLFFYHNWGPSGRGQGREELLDVRQAGFSPLGRWRKSLHLSEVKVHRGRSGPVSLLLGSLPPSKRRSLEAGNRLGVTECRYRPGTQKEGPVLCVGGTFV